MKNFYRFVFPEIGKMPTITMFCCDEDGKTKEQWALERYNRLRGKLLLPAVKGLPASTEISIAETV
jgi:hypothetical protein